MFLLIRRELFLYCSAEEISTHNTFPLLQVLHCFIFTHLVSVVNYGMQVRQTCEDKFQLSVL